MTAPRTRRVAAALLAAVGATACASAGAGNGAAAPAPARSAAIASGDEAAVARARADSARYPYTQADVEFMSNMIGHHAQAIVMAEMAPTHGASPSVQTLAGRIINAQRDEIATMQHWLRDRGKPVPEVSATGMMMMGGEHHHMLMPGMLTEEQLRELDAAQGAAFDRLFLTYMIQHHRGAVAMVKELFDSYGAGQDETVFKFASDVNVDQTTEIARMQKMLAAILFQVPSQQPSP